MMNSNSNYNHDVVVVEDITGNDMNNHYVDEDDDNNSNNVTTHDSITTTSSSSLLSMLEASALFTADMLGTGLLALPQDIKVLGTMFGLGFLIIMIPINWYAGYLLSQSAMKVDYDYYNTNNTNNNGISQQPLETKDGIIRTITTAASSSNNSNKKSNSKYVQVRQQSGADESNDSIPNKMDVVNEIIEDDVGNNVIDHDNYNENNSNHYSDELKSTSTHGNSNTTTNDPTHDYVIMSQIVFQHPNATIYQPRMVHIVMIIFYTNIFLVLGDYILVMSHAVSAMFNDNLCIVKAGLVASILIYTLSQISTMANLGHTVTFISLSCLAIVVIQCLIAANLHEDEAIIEEEDNDDDEIQSMTKIKLLLRKFSALASIGFATGSNKLLLNIRNEMKHRTEAPYTLAIALITMGIIYVIICLLAGPNPPSFLFDSIPYGFQRQLGGFLLWVHVAVSYAINSQAICSSIDRIFISKITIHYNINQLQPKQRWMILTFILTISSYIISNAIPFFKDLVSLIGALTAVPLALLFPAIFYRKVIIMDNNNNNDDYQNNNNNSHDNILVTLLFIFSSIFLFLGLLGAIGSIEMDWANHHEPPFSCNH